MTSRQFVRRTDRRGGTGGLIGRERRQGERRQVQIGTLARIFRDVPAAAVLDALDHCAVVTHAERVVLLEPGTINCHIYISLAGTLTLELGTEESPHPIVLQRGQAVGEMSISDGKPVSARVVAEADSDILVIDETTFWQRLMSIPGVARNMLTIQSERIRRSDDRFIAKLRDEMAYEQIKRDLSMAAEIQLNMLPRRFPLYPDRDEFGIYAIMLPAREVGGDFYDVFLVDRDQLFFIVGDVSGKGVAAALFMTRAMTLFRIEASHQLLPHDILRNVNAQLAENNENCMFVTVICGVLDVRTGGVVYSNAGHIPPLIGGADGFRYIDVPHGPAIGLVEDGVYSTREVRLRSGEIFMLTTDGVTEAMGDGNEEYSEPRLLDELTRIGTASVQHTVDQLCLSIAAFTQGRTQSDDITVLAIKLH